MSDELTDTIDFVVEPPAFIPASVLADLSEEGRERLFRSLYEMKQEGRPGAKVAMNSTFGEMTWVSEDE